MHNFFKNKNLQCMFITYNLYINLKVANPNTQTVEKLKKQRKLKTLTY